MKTKEAYLAFMETPFWRDLAIRTKQRARHHCERCGDQQRLQAHHKVYRNRWEDTQLDDLECLCWHCHKLEHQLAMPSKKKLNKIRRWQKGLKTLNSKQRRRLKRLKARPQPVSARAKAWKESLIPKHGFTGNIFHGSIEPEDHRYRINTRN